MRGREIFGWLVAAGALIAFVSGSSPRGETISGPVRVVDGDSLHVGDTEVRLFGVDAFEGREMRWMDSGTSSRPSSSCRHRCRVMSKGCRRPVGAGTRITHRIRQT